MSQQQQQQQQQQRQHSVRLLLLGGVLKALFTTSPFKASEVIVKENGDVEVKAKELVGTATTSPKS